MKYRRTLHEKGSKKPEQSAKSDKLEIDLASSKVMNK